MASPTQINKKTRNSSQSAADAPPSNALSTSAQQPTSFAARKRKRSRMSMDCLLGMSARSPEPIKDHANIFDPESLVHNTWGHNATGPVRSLDKRRWGAGGLRKAAGVSGAFRNFMMGDAVDGQKGSTNSPERSNLLRLPLELRQHIYGYLFARPSIILVEEDWLTLRTHYNFSHSIMKTCRQIAMETRGAFYGMKTFWLKLRKPDDPVLLCKIDNKFIPCIRNVVIECVHAREWSTWQQRIVASINKLQHNDSLHTFTLQIPASIMRSDANRSCSINLGSLFMVHMPTRKMSPVLDAITKLSCSVFNLIIKLDDRRRVLIAIELRCLHSRARDGELVDDAAKWWRNLAAVAVGRDFSRLKYRIEWIAVDPDRAVANGCGRLLADHESAGDGMKLFQRTKASSFGALLELTRTADV